VLGQLARAGPDDRLAGVVDLVGDPVALVEADAGQDRGKSLGDVVEGVVVVVAPRPEPGPATRGFSMVDGATSAIMPREAG
jgi:hypothetical protein